MLKQKNIKIKEEGNTFGCLVIAKESIKDKNNPKEFADNILGADSSKKKDLANIIKEANGLSQYLFDEDTRIKLKSDTASIARAEAEARVKAVAEHIEIRIKNNFKQTKAKEQEETLPPNIIRIETEDESEDFIEIVSPLIYDPPLQDTSAILIPALRIVGTAFKGLKGASGVAKIFWRGLTREETESFLINRYDLKRSKEINNSRRHSKLILWAKDSKYIKEIGRDLIKDARYIGKNERSMNIKGDKSRQERIEIDSYILEDKKINIRDNSQSGGSTIDVIYQDKSKTKIHNIEDLRK